jgi:hypothetical protein
MPVLTENKTDDWLLRKGHAHLVEAARNGHISYMTALQSAIDPRSLSRRLSDWDCERSLVKTTERH